MTLSGMQWDLSRYQCHMTTPKPLFTTTTGSGLMPFFKRTRLSRRDIDAGRDTSRNNDPPPIPLTPTSFVVESTTSIDLLWEGIKIAYPGFFPRQQEETASVLTRCPTPIPATGQKGTASTATGSNRTSINKSQFQTHRCPAPDLSTPRHRIRLVPHAPHRSVASLRFHIPTRDLRENDPPLWIGRFTHSPFHLDKLAFRTNVISRNHAEIWVEAGGKFYIRDTGSSSGTFLNYRRLSEANLASEPFQIKNGDVLQLGVTCRGGKEVSHRSVGIRIRIDGLISPPSAKEDFSPGPSIKVVSQSSHIGLG